ncbi:MAG: 16S rRNA (guanine(966)-N(2))-methyltransferase RsmD [Pseudomonadota bacterium]
MRIIGGQHRGLTLASVGKGDTSAHLRPTSDRVRESLFNVLQGGRFGDPIADARVLDLFAGTGALGLEALSRGAVHATFVDNGRTAQRLITENIQKCGRKADTQLLTCTTDRLPKATTPCALIFADPPYGKGLGQTALTQAAGSGWIAPDALIILEEGTALPAPVGFTQLDQRRYGDTWITFMRPA